MVQIHYRKIRKCFFEDVKENRKPFEIRKEDRDPPFKVGDILILVEIDEEDKETGRSLRTIIEYIYRGEFCLPGYCVMGIRQTARWISNCNGQNIWRCSACGILMDSETALDNRRFHKFCHNCGAKMTEV